MIKNFLLTLSLILLVTPATMAATQSMTPEVNRGIQKYRAGNYVGCIQELDEYLKKAGSNQLGTYYLAMAYTKIGDSANAIKFYNKTKALNPNNTLGQYAQKGIVCIEDPSNCYNRVKPKTQVEELTELDRFVRAPYGNGLSSDLTKQIERGHVEKLRKEMNTEEELNKYEFKDFKVFSNRKSSSDDISGVKIASSKPTDAEIVKALRVLNDAGLTNLTPQYQPAQKVNASAKSDAAISTESQNEVKSAYKPDITKEEYQKQIQQEMMQAQMAAMSQPDIGALFGEKNNQNNMMNNNMMNMLPFMMAQQGQNGGQQPAMSPDMMQAMMFNSMMPNLNLGTDNNR